MFFKKSKIKVDDSGPITDSERKRLNALQRFISDETMMFGKKVQIVDSSSFLSSLDEIFKGEIYKFHTTDQKINIIDCGANIGLATIYFKRAFPDASVIAFEPDPNIFKAMKANVESFGFEKVTFRNEAISNQDTTISFHLEGGHSGMIVQEQIDDKVVPIKATRLKNVLQEFDQVTFLKIDIEGHEVKVMPDIAEELKKVQYMFLEYHSFVDEPQVLGEMLEIIRKAGLRYYIKESYNKQLPFINREIFLKMDLLVNIFCYRD